ncbi:TRAM domain-containing protein [Brachyspira hyodysenteriae]|uniref:RNA methyltransferase, TrmA family n=1 Tax=Brachyspira hyodysenteriae (strain ATCC 49526 / WA1) TaxID=565034 RepID=A0A3B6VEC6_BRAHW|nr:TRAM domain-containing protein [Brachyspira hyodysenteriae]ACN83174.1 RNA methyltransferase, TrmA family [Brachyspira hyodysenteriae WA1]AUJ48917.1 RNA methyltransferase [Brachyspira hyodysenteriae]KLI32969.1 RNA methyltransferase [Brachyspira hyodysenteriae]KLI44189.1 RNA methyltransferase [Brachyspira hyodysenteriae]KLI49429.1 RNA methyltransferase [Brachyspira hyodysenteriae]
MEVKIIDTAYGGYGIAKDENGKVIFIPHSVEGDILDITITKESKKFSYASINKILESSKFRIKPKCKYAGICGGCLFNHIEYNKQLDTKKNVVLNAIRNIDFNNDIKMIYGENINYRLRVNMIADNGKIGFYRFKSNDFVNIDECIILKESLFEKIKNFASENNITGSIYAIENNNNEALAFIELNKKINIKCFEKYFKGITIKNNKNIKSYGSDTILYKTKYGNIPIGHKTFFQSNLYLLDDFQYNVIKYLSDNDSSIVELYAGSGFFTSALENKIKSFNNHYKFIASEINKDSVLIANKYDLKIKNEDALITLKNIDYDIDALILDPPREGMNKNVVEEIIRIKPKKIIYVSCDPMTFARDINLLKEYYNLSDLNIIDMFADTYHIELISFLEYKD